MSDVIILQRGYFQNTIALYEDRNDPQIYTSSYDHETIKLSLDQAQKLLSGWALCLGLGEDEYTAKIYVQDSRPE